jgi:1-acyl-sn-glycerol-3-phosphate acyltransferase
LGWRLPGLTLWLFLGLLLAIFYRFLGKSIRHITARVFARGVLFFCGVSLKSPSAGLREATAPAMVTGGGVPAGLVICNHISWIDIFVIQAQWPSVFIAKSEIRAWPLVGWLVAGSGTIFIERGNRRAIPGVIQRAQQCFSKGERVAFFPEGTTSDGENVLPFHASLFSMLENAPQTPLTLMAIRYKENDQPTKATAYIDEMTLWESILRIMSTPRLSVACSTAPFFTEPAPLSGNPPPGPNLIHPLDRRALAHASRNQVLGLLQTQ